MGVDRPGDMDYLLAIAHPNIAVITNIGISHYQFFKTEAAVEQEKGKLAVCLKPNETLIVNQDNPAAARQVDKTKAKIISYGWNSGSTVRMEEARENFEKDFTEAVIKTPSKQIFAKISALGPTHLSSVLAATAVGEALGIEADLIRKGLQRVPAHARKIKSYFRLKTHYLN